MMSFVLFLFGLLMLVGVLFLVGLVVVKFLIVSRRMWEKEFPHQNY